MRTMSNHLAIATVTAALGSVVHKAAETSGVGSVGLSFGKPTSVVGEQTERKVHVYLYEVSPNSSLRNDDLPTRGSDGTLVSRPKAVLNLRYLIAFYGDQQSLEPDRMLGAAVRDLHSRPLISRRSIQDALVNHPELEDTDLDNAIERVRLTPAAVSLDELSKVWSVFFQTPHALSVVYDAKVVLIEAKESGPTALPVLRRGQDDRGVYVQLGPFPLIESIYYGTSEDNILQPRPTSMPAGRLGLALIVSGRNLGGDDVLLRFVHSRLGLTKEVRVSSADLSETELKVKLPDPGSGTNQTDWAPGVYTVSVVRIRSGDTHELTSNGLPIAFAPIINAREPAGDIQRDAHGTATITITCQPRVRSEQRVILLVGGIESGGNIDPINPDKIIFRIKNAPAVNNEIIRLRVDGIESMPFNRVDAPPPTRFVFDTGQSQRVTIT